MTIWTDYKPVVSAMNTAESKGNPGIHAGEPIPAPTAVPEPQNATTATPNSHVQTESQLNAGQRPEKDWTLFAS